MAERASSYAHAGSAPHFETNQWRRYLRGLATSLRAWLPQGGSLPNAEWQRRHAGIMALLWFNVLAVPAFALVAGRSSTLHDLESGLALAVMAAIAASQRMSRKLRMATSSLALLSAVALVVHASGGIVVMHFYFFVIIIVLTLYEDWMPFLLALVFVLLHHGVIGTLEPKTVFDRPQEWAHPWVWAALHAAFVGAAGAAGLVAWRLNENVRGQMRDAHEQIEIISLTDSLTGLGNRRKLMGDLERIVASNEPALLVLLDLDGFKAYNDTFGHPAGDSLLSRLGQRIAAAVGERGSAYRLGGDEFCAIWHIDEAGHANAEAVSAAALRERGDGFAIAAAYGAVAIPAEALTPEAALHAADLRMYSLKNSARPSSSIQSRDVLLRALAELRPQLGEHIDAVTVLAEEVARRLELPAHIVEQVGHAAQLHDVGKIAIPDAILNKPGSLDAEEWRFMRRHTIIGERIVAAAPALSEAARLIRSSHERFGGGGYPDGLCGEEIPIGSRVITVCDAFDAMIADRPYRMSLSPTEAMRELERCAGSQFDPVVVEAFRETLSEPLTGARAVRATLAHTRLTEVDTHVTSADAVAAAHEASEQGSV
jgi:diguanylate cyclase (GGDEF)-like protein